MQNLDISVDGSPSLTLAADARLVETDINDDQIWELSLGGGEPPALALQTTYGLRAHWMRLFPRFVRGDTARTDPSGFHQPPRITTFYPNYLAFVFEPFEGLEVSAEYWVADSHTVIGRLKLVNNSILPLNFRLELVALLNPISRQGGMSPAVYGPNTVLEGETAYLTPVVFLTGGPHASPGPYPALSLDLEMYPGNSRQFSWAAASLRSKEASLEAARAATARNWDAELARMDLLNFSQDVQVRTGNREWDTAFALAQRAAYNLLMKNAGSLPEPSFVLNRRPDQGFSVRGDGSDHSHLWSGQTALDAYYLASLLTPGAAGLAAGLLRNFLAVQDETGAIDMKPGLAGQRSRRMAQPVLASLAVRLAPHMPAGWYAEVFPGLLRFLNAWFRPERDSDGDGFPEWEHPLQTGMEESPIYDRWSENAQGIDITTLESPALAAMLYRECQSLIEMARALLETEKAGAAYARLSGEEPVSASGAGEALPLLCERSDALLAALQSTWNEDDALYHYRDTQTHLCLPGTSVIEFRGSGRMVSRKRFPQPHRLIVQVEMREERTFAGTLTIYGFTADGEVSETIGARSFSLHGRLARATTQNTYLAIKQIAAQGLSEDDRARVFTADYTQEDTSLLTPLWAGVPTTEQARKLVEDTILPRFLLPFGVPLCPPSALQQDMLPGLHTACASALMPWNHLIGEGLLRYGCRAEAAELVTRLMAAVTQSLKEHQSFRQYYHAATGLSAGERDHLHGLAPLGLFLQVLGIRSLGTKEILIDGFNPFPSTIIVQYRKVQLTCSADKTEIVFPGGQTITVDRPGLHRITMKG